MNTFTRVLYQRGRQAGVSLVEVVMATGIVGIVAAGGYYQMKNINVVKANLARGQAVDVIEFGTRKLLEQDDVILATVARSNSPALKQCFAGKGCQSPANPATKDQPIPVKAYSVQMYLPGQTKPFAGKSVFFDKNGTLWDPNAPGSVRPRSRYRMLTDLLVGCDAACASPSHVAVRFAIQKWDSNKRSWRTLRADTVDRIDNGKFSLKGMTLECPAQQVLRGVGVQGEPICVSINDLEYEGTTNGNNIVVDIKPRDCRTLNKDAKDQYYVHGYDKEGNIKCEPKTW